MNKKNRSNLWINLKQVILFSLIFLTFYLFVRWNPSFKIEIETAQMTDDVNDYLCIYLCWRSKALYYTWTEPLFFYLLNGLISFYWVFPLLVVALNLINIPVIIMTMMYNWNVFIQSLFSLCVWSAVIWFGWVENHLLYALEEYNKNGYFVTVLIQPLNKNFCLLLFLFPSFPLSVNTNS